MELMITARVEEVRQEIVRRHDGAISDISICLGQYDKDSHLDLKKKLCEQGVDTEGDYTLVYDFNPISHPLLTTAL